jgi:hypothetical protein
MGMGKKEEKGKETDYRGDDIWNEDKSTASRTEIAHSQEEASRGHYLLDHRGLAYHFGGNIESYDGFVYFATEKLVWVPLTRWSAGGRGEKADDGAWGV